MGFWGILGKGFRIDSWFLIRCFIPRENLQNCWTIENVVWRCANETILLKLRCDLWLICKWLLFPIASITLDICQFKPFHTKLEIHICPKLSDHVCFQITLKNTEYKHFLTILFNPVLIDKCCTRNIYKKHSEMISFLNWPLQNLFSCLVNEYRKSIYLWIFYTILPHILGYDHIECSHI